ncbi:probable aspartic proteinase GIP2 [Nicotiana tomentosiformis]|uniref:Basic 7S globulin-like n=1 Tax=Nicotiana tabacum TaxID=4097 RepID=A0A1S4AXN2_TOBAC|nr:probable aspartic proteinase GIP2 [Nicotiana tomentosiformis]XP_016481248.1 PREDICTED: basic 7S globulin-like [Nicotiana tabacum]
MDVSSINALFFLSLLLLFSSSTAKTHSRPRALLLPVTKDAATKQYVTVIRQRTPLVPVKLTIDLGQRFLWVDCEKGYVSSSYKPVPCDSTPCKRSFSGACAVGNNHSTCVHDPYNPFIHTSTGGELAQDVVSLQSTDGSNPGRFIGSARPGVVFGCGATFLLEGLANGVKGIAGLGNGFIGLPSQLADAFHLDRKFAICLSSSTTSKGVIFFGNSPYVFLPDIDVSKRLVYTPLLKNPVSTSGSYFRGEPSMEYFIGVKSIKINGNVVPINTTLLTIAKNGIGGTKISTVDPYTKLETSIYNAFTKAFVKSLAKVARVKSVAPFRVCYNSTSLGSTRVGPGVPPIELVLGSNKDAKSWTIWGVNSMVVVNNEVLCLGFVDGGFEPTTSIVIGAHQIEDNLLQFDIANKRMGFSSSLLFSRTTCANFNLTSKA